MADGDPLIRTDTNLKIILYATKKQLVADNTYPANMVFLTTGPEQNIVPPTINYCVIRAKNQDLINYTASTQLGKLEITCYNRFSVDELNRANYQLQDKSGVEAAADAVDQSLQLTDLTVNNKWILAEPLHLISRSDPIIENQWCRVVLVYQIKYGYDPSILTPAEATCIEFTNSFTNEFC